MFSGKITDRIEILSTSGIHLHPGEFVSLKIVKSLFHNKWAVSIGGKLLTAYSDIDLNPGQVVKARVLVEENRLVLKIAPKNIDAVNVLLEKYSIEPDALTRAIVMSFLKTGLAVREENIIAIKNLIKNSKKSKTKLIRLLTIMLDKGITLKHLDMEKILPLIFEDSQSSRKERERRKKQGYNREKRLEELKKYINSRVESVSSSDANLLQIFNHIKAVHDNWITTPFRIENEKITLSGSIRIQYDYFKKIVNIIVIQCSFDSVDLSFILKNQQQNYTLSILCNKEDYAKILKRELPKLNIKLQNLGVKIDDTILEDTYFDGFSLEKLKEVYKPIDTVG